MAVSVPDVLGRLWPEAERMLKEAGCAYEVERTRPTKNFFPIDEEQLYVIRGKWLPAGQLRLTLAAKIVKRSQSEI